MVDTDKDTGGKIALFGGGALVAAAIIAAQKTKAQAAPGSNVVKLDDATMQLLMAIAASTADLEQLLAELISQGQPAIQGYPLNTPFITATRVQCAVLDVAYRLPDIVVPDGFQLQVAGYPTNGGTVYIGESAAAARNINQSWPLIANEGIAYGVKNANAIYVCAISPPVGGGVAGNWLKITVERR